VDKPYCDKNFQIEFENIKELENLRDSLNHMLKYIRMCEEDGEETPPLVYKIFEKPKTNNSKNK
jgi:uncharacterized protein YdeI (YjbR/CyaY-like superfamily)